MEQHFRPTTTDPGFDVVTENRFFVDRDGVEWEELTFSVNGTKWGPDRPAFPLLQAEKVLSPPLDLRLDADYRYRLDGTDDRRRRRLLRRPLRAERDVARRRRSIAARSGSIARRSAAASCRRCRPGWARRSSRTTRRCASRRVGAAGGREIFLPIEIVTRQIVLVAGRNILVEKATRFSDYQLNPADFEARRVEARRSDRVMYRDTDKGMRYYVKEGDTRVVSDKATTQRQGDGDRHDDRSVVRLPAADPRHQLSRLRVRQPGLAARAAVRRRARARQRPAAEAARTPIDGSVDFFAIAVPGSDSVYDASRATRGASAS